MIDAVVAMWIFEESMAAKTGNSIVGFRPGARVVTSAMAAYLKVGETQIKNSFCVFSALFVFFQLVSFILSNPFTHTEGERSGNRGKLHGRLGWISNAFA